jgi:hypothetical protein
MPTACTTASCEFRAKTESKNMNHLISTRFSTRIARLMLLLSLSVSLAPAQTNSRNYTLLIGSGFLCDLSDASTCPATTKAVQGDTYELSGVGVFNPQSKWVNVTGTFSHKSNNGNMVETGVWVASELVSFVSYGVAPTALLNEKSGLNAVQQVHMRLKIPFGPMPTGGRAVFRVRLLTLAGAAKTGVLQVNCALGNVPQERTVEGIRLSLEGDKNEFAEEVGGRVMFLSMRPETSSNAKAPANREQSDSAKKTDN